MGLCHRRSPLIYLWNANSNKTCNDMRARHQKVALTAHSTEEGGEDLAGRFALVRSVSHRDLTWHGVNSEKQPLRLSVHPKPPTREPSSFSFSCVWRRLVGNPWLLPPPAEEPLLEQGWGCTSARTASLWLA